MKLARSMKAEEAADVVVMAVEAVVVDAGATVDTAVVVVAGAEAMAVEAGAVDAEAMVAVDATGSFSFLSF